MNKQLTDVSLIRKLAWSFHKSSGIDWKDLFQEASIAAYEAQKSFNPEKGSASTYLWICIHNHLMNYVSSQSLYHEPMETMEDMSTIQAEMETSDLFDKLTEKAKQIANVILTNPERYDCMSPHEAKILVGKVLIRQLGWTWKDVRQGMSELRASLT